MFLIKIILLQNLLAGGAVWVGYRFFDVPYMLGQDALFYMFALQWGMAALVWNGGRSSVKYDQDPAARTTNKMLSSAQVQADKKKAFAANYHFGLQLFISGLLPLIVCVMYSVL
ncbi:hypothetical protein KDD30_19570 (plasmid) [Photobacterium sp. GJ3]|uniref:hypothetical protein n=1 Tax=Photobacterium sp. GJ3 TaxID=2829502 RepID=UPI001B8AFD4E|nr:hypothetical protein [Photobacterium sp. GJ3]QUJ70317.1 hypothetical protein KDD30_19570 [Photobacterium sp. GJ3]